VEGDPLLELEHELCRVVEYLVLRDEVGFGFDIPIQNEQRLVYGRESDSFRDPPRFVYVQGARFGIHSDTKLLAAVSGTTVVSGGLVVPGTIVSRVVVATETASQSTSDTDSQCCK